MKFAVARHGPVVVLSLEGEFEGDGLAKFSATVDPLFAAGDVRWVLDVFELRFVNSSALGTLLALSKRARAVGGDVVVARPSSFVARVLTTLGVGVALRQFPTVEAALAHFGEGGARPAK